MSANSVGLSPLFTKWKPSTKWGGVLLFILLLSLPVSAQESPAALTISDVSVTTATDLYGQAIQQAVGALTNTDAATAYLDVSLTATAYDADDTEVGTGFGFLVDSCGAGLLPDFALQPGHTQPFSVPLDFDLPNAQVSRVEIVVDAQPAPFTGAADLPAGINAVTDAEVVAVEWEGPRSLRYAVGCARDLFFQWNWTQFSTLTGSAQPTQHPQAALVTDALRETLRLTDPLIFANSRLTFTPDGTRLAYQDAVNRFYTAAADGRLQRQLYGRLNNRTLQGIDWLDDNRFLAYYYGAYGNPVLYFTADAEGRYLSPPPLENPASVIVPGASRDGRRVIIAGTFPDENGADVTGYYINVVTNNFFELLFEGTPPGINYPAPVPIVDVAQDVVTRVYLARPADGSPDSPPVLQCFNREVGVLVNLTTLPLQLADGDRARMWLSPDERTLALAANGAHGGLWLIDLDALPACVSAADATPEATASS